MINNQDIRILVVDDEDVVVSLIRDALEDNDYTVETAQNGRDALNILTGTVIHLLITDIRMHPMDGIELAKKAREHNPDTSIIFMTGYANLNSAKDAIRQGAVDYILKPFELTEIRQSVNKAVEKIRESAHQKSSVSQIDRLSDLSQMLYEVGDRKSLVRISLEYAMIQTDARCGTFLYWDASKSNYTVITMIDKQTSEHILPTKQMRQGLKQAKLSDFHRPTVLSDLSDHPLNHLRETPEVSQVLFPVASLKIPMQVVMAPIRRADAIYGIATLYVSRDKQILEKSDLKLFSITTSQLALSLENLFLLEEAQAAYSQLRELQDETIQLEKMATRGEISAEIGHELNNFLGVVAGNLSLLDVKIKKQKFDQIDKHVQVMSENIEKIKSFTSNLMDLRPISSAKEIVEFDKLVAEVVDYLKPQKRFDGVSIKLEPIEVSIPFEADSTHIQQLLYNLFNNAADATADREQREIVIKVTVSESNDSFCLSISDNGVGIPPEMLEKVFREKFTTKPDGHGFGLLVCQRIIEAHQGKLHINSIPGERTTITVEFPLATSPELTPVSV